jgi:hypothetical protein
MSPSDCSSPEFLPSATHIPYIPFKCRCGKVFHHKLQIDFELVVQSLYMPSWFDFSVSPSLSSKDEDSAFKFLSQFYSTPHQVNMPCQQLQTRLLSSLINFVYSSPDKPSRLQDDPSATFLRINSGCYTPAALTPFLISFLDALRCSRGIQTSIGREELVEIIREKCEKGEEMKVDESVLDELRKSLEALKSKTEMNADLEFNSEKGEGIDSLHNHFGFLVPDFLPPSFSPSALLAPCHRFYLSLYQMIHLSISAVLLYSFHTSEQSPTFLCSSAIAANECVRLLVCVYFFILV